MPNILLFCEAKRIEFYRPGLYVLTKGEPPVSGCPFPLPPLAVLIFLSYVLAISEKYGIIAPLLIINPSIKYGID
jgi:hypothetical protein